MLLAPLLACQSPADDAATPPAPYSAPTPWEDAAATELLASGGFLAEMGATLPGGGWFVAGELTGQEAAVVRRADVGATWPVVQVLLYGYDEAGWRTLEIDVALNRWVAGEVPIDGDSAVGSVVTDDGTLYLDGGTLLLTDAGVEDGQAVAGSFADVPLWGP